MDELYPAELKLIAALQKHGNFSFGMNLFSYLGYEALLVLLPLVYFCFNAKAGVRLAFVFLLGGILQDIFKLILHLPRPYWIDSDIQSFGLKLSTHYGMPSGHSQWATSCWLFVAMLLKKTWAWIGALLIIILVGLSRVYLGAHFISDVLSGCLLGLMVLLLYLRLEPRAVRWLTKLRFWSQIRAALCGAIAVILAGFAVRAAIAGTRDPEAWTAFADKARDLKSIVGFGGVILGLGAGLAMARQWARFDAGGPWLQRAMRLAIGGLVAFGIIKGLEQISPRGSEATALVVAFVRFALGAWWVIFLAPILFLKWNLAVPLERSVDGPPEM